MEGWGSVSCLYFTFFFIPKYLIGAFHLSASYYIRKYNVLVIYFLQPQEALPLYPTSAAVRQAMPSCYQKYISFMCFYCKVLDKTSRISVQVIVCCLTEGRIVNLMSKVVSVPSSGQDPLLGSQRYTEYMLVMILISIFLILFPP